MGRRLTDPVVRAGRALKIDIPFHMTVQNPYLGVQVRHARARESKIQL